MEVLWSEECEEHRVDEERPAHHDAGRETDPDVSPLGGQVCPAKHEVQRGGDSTHQEGGDQDLRRNEVLHAAQPTQDRSRSCGTPSLADQNLVKEQEHQRRYWYEDKKEVPEVERDIRREAVDQAPEEGGWPPSGPSTQNQTHRKR
jgi:hypothetical protein